VKSNDELTKRFAASFATQSSHKHLSKDEKTRIEAALVDFLRAADSFSFPRIFEQALGSRKAWTIGEEREFKKLLWRAMQRLLDEGIDFAVVRGAPGVYARANFQQIARRSKNWRRRSLRTAERGVKRAYVAAALAPSEEKGRLTKAAEWQALKLVMSSRSPKKLPPGIEE
jgi:hypothetical protein